MPDKSIPNFKRKLLVVSEAYVLPLNAAVEAYYTCYSIVFIPRLVGVLLPDTCKLDSGSSICQTEPSARVHPALF